MFNGLVFHINRAVMLIDSPMAILSKQDNKYDPVSLKNFLGFHQLASVLEVAGILSAMIIIVASVMTLYVANYMKTRAQTKEKIIMGLSAVAYIAAFPFLADVIITLIKTAFLK